MTDRLLTVLQVAEHVQLDETTVRRAIRRGDLEASKPCGQLRIHPDAVTDWLEQTKVERPVTIARAPAPRAPRPVPAPVQGSRSSFRDKTRQRREAA